ncbi:MAG: phosphatidylglycerol lysyltransferase domain-containing protein [Bacteroidales bacterium]|jgi:hypothetical protein|nr:phosphatidylglycerol lysyltransferase domain-containing protein [Bacteroidales bacterium]
MFSFKLIKPEDKNLLQPILLNIPYRLCNFTFSNMIIWGSTYSPAYCIIDGMLCIVSQPDEQKYFNFPLGNGNEKQVIDQLMEYAEKQNIPFVLINITEEMKAKLQTFYPNKFRFSFSEDYSDYLYKVEDLLHLQGKKYQPKRNHINKFKRLYPDYLYNSMTANDIEDCFEMHKHWAEVHCKQNQNNKTLEIETCATRKALLLFEALELKGGVLRVDGKVAAFTLGTPVNSNTFDICVEKALQEYDGAYPMINQLFLQNHVSAYSFVNREEDLGEEGLRKAKLSYYPHTQIVKYTAVLE